MMLPIGKYKSVVFEGAANLPSLTALQILPVCRKQARQTGGRT